ncbi:MAG: hypothetical protein JWP75_4191 [Frondihabitans sp.]|nr:hypothetical protein [Frondihabitans sp.]
MATALVKVDLTAPSGTVNCPSDSGSFAIIALSYPGARSVDVFWATTGCQVLDNGRLGSWYVTNPSFWAFRTAFDKVADLPNGPGVQ